MVDHGELGIGGRTGHILGLDGQLGYGCGPNAPVAIIGREQHVRQPGLHDVGFGPCRIDVERGLLVLNQVGGYVRCILAVILLQVLQPPLLDGITLCHSVIGFYAENSRDLLNGIESSLDVAFFMLGVVGHLNLLEV